VIGYELNDRASVLGRVVFVIGFKSAWGPRRLLSNESWGSFLKGYAAEI
jgi:hypothetical protein